MAIPLTLRVSRNGQAVATREFERDIIKIGRLSSAHLCIDDERVSRIHAVIEVAGDGAVSIIDMGSVEGTRVNGKRISKIALASGDAIDLGETRIEVAFGPQAEESAPAPVAADPAAASAAAVSAAAEETTPGPGAAAVPPEVLAAAQQAAAQVIAAAQAAAAQAAGQHVSMPEAAANVALQAAGINVVAPNVAVPAANELVQQQPAEAPAPAQVVAAAVAAEQAPNTAIAIPESVVAPPAPGTVGELWSRPEIAAGRASLLRRPLAPEEKQALALRSAPLPRGATDRALQLDVRIFWGDQQLEVGHFDDSEKVTIGSAATNDFLYEGEHLSAESFSIARRVDGGWVIAFTSAMDGEWISEAGAQRLSDLVKAGKVRPGDEPGTFELPLAGHEAAWVDLGNLRVDFCFRPKPRVAAAPWSQRLDYRFLNVFVVAAFFVIGSIVTATNSATDVDTVQDDLHSNNARWAKTLFEAPKPKHNPFMEKMNFKAPGDIGPGEMAAKAAGEEGKMGKPDAPQRNTRSAPRGDPNEKEQVKNQGILAMLGKGNNAGLSTIFGTGGLGGDLKGAIGGITGASVGDAHGFGGLGLKGTGKGGGGVGNTIGVGDVGTKGRGGGTASFGKGVGGLGKKGSSDVQISSSEAIIVGYDKELVRRVVHSHHSQLRYCYESELVRQPNMNGKVTMKWVIGTQGKVTQVDVVGSTLNNARVESCLKTRVKSWNFPAPKGGGIAVVTYPFVFRPSGG